MAWRVARSLDTLLAQINAAAPDRSKRSDGSIGDAAHSSRVSDHNPNPDGVVCARDFTHDPDGGFDCDELASDLVASGDERVKYVIWNRRIWNPRLPYWRPYFGINPHTQHLHLSVDGPVDSTREWALPKVTGADAENQPPQPEPTYVEVAVAQLPELKSGDEGKHVAVMQRLLGEVDDGDFGPLTKAALVKFQANRELDADGICGQQSWHALLRVKPPTTTAR